MKNLIKRLLKEESNKVLLFEELSLLIEKELVIGPGLTKKLNSINKDSAKELLKILSSDKIPEKVTIDAIDYTSDDDKTLTGFFKDREGNTKARKFKIGKLLDYIGVPKDKFKGYELEELISYLKKNDNAEHSNFKVVSSEKILWAYLCDNYDETGYDPTMGSCMRYESAQSYLKIYVDNPDSVKCLVLINPNNNKVRGRALIWKLDNGSLYMDRIYTTDQQATKPLFKEYGKKLGVSGYYDENDEPSDVVTLENGDEYEEYPYMDTFKYYSPNTDVLSIEKIYSDSLVLQDNDGGSNPAETYDYGSYEGEEIDEDEAEYLEYEANGEYIQGYAHHSDITWVEYDEQYYLDEHIIKDYKGDDIFKYNAIKLDPNRYENGSLYAHEDDENIVQLHEEYGDNFFALKDDVIETYSGDYAYENDVRPLIDSKYIGEDNNRQYALDTEVVQLYPDYYEEDVYALFDDVLKINIPYDGEFWILEDDYEDFEEYVVEGTKLKGRVIGESKNLIKRLLREGLLSESKATETQAINILWNQIK